MTYNLVHTRHTSAIAVCLLLTALPATAHTIDILELPNGGGTRAVTDGSILNTFPASETISVGVNFNDGNYLPQVLNVNVYDDAAHTTVSDQLTITVPSANPPQITVGLTSMTPGIPLSALTPESIGITETGALQPIVTLTNSNGIQTTIRLQSNEPAGGTGLPGVPEPAPFLLTATGVAGLITFSRRRPRCY